MFFLTHTHTHTCARTHTCVQAHTHTVYARSRTHARTGTHAHAYTHEHTYTRAHPHTHVSTAKPVSIFKQGTRIEFQNFCIKIHNDRYFFYCQQNCNIDINLPHSHRSTVRPYAASNHLLTSQITKTCNNTAVRVVWTQLCLTATRWGLPEGVPKIAESDY